MLHHVSRFSTVAREMMSLQQHCIFEFEFKLAFGTNYSFLPMYVALYMSCHQRPHLLISEKASHFWFSIFSIFHLPGFGTIVPVNTMLWRHNWMLHSISIVSIYLLYYQRISATMVDKSVSTSHPCPCCGKGNYPSTCALTNHLNNCNNLFIALPHRSTKWQRYAQQLLGQCADQTFSQWGTHTCPAFKQMWIDYLFYLSIQWLCLSQQIITCRITTLGTMFPVTMTTTILMIKQ